VHYQAPTAKPIHSSAGSAECPLRGHYRKSEDALPSSAFPLRTDIDASNPPAICRAININKAEDVPKALVLSLLRFINR
jgi:hypothetical protein